ncbi:hypothetical protein NEF87_001003 [Candidatus Lokiarchaeum ossiferum]|uniref:Major facilitator superfamily (MFS) profile domain-containing protein n=1 Tax=Candidatus Lokiarchaeum ossiferum TaxID=2951803 RepID=A0ABY6HN39_9ARCH|nr:hypothetical protein NEF87_001003 [Candidatus Lokiarchaeum sp. B-35]
MKNAKVLPFQKQKSIKANKSYKTWPLFTISFVKTFANAIYSLALSNYLIYEKGMASSLVGTISSATAIAYIIGPFFGNKMKDIIGIKNSIIFSSITTTLFIVLQLLFFEPWILISTRILDGIIMGMFWPNLLVLVSSWQKVSTEGQSETNFKNFNKSWSFGLIGGFASGYVIVFFLTDYIAILISLGIGAIMIPISFLCENEIKYGEVNENQDILISISEKSQSISQSTFPATVFPIVLSWIGIIFMTSSKAIFQFSLPFFLKDAGKDSEWVYIITLVIQLLQIIALNKVATFKIRDKQRIFPIGIAGISLLAIFVILFQNIYVVILTTVLLGLMVGLIQGVCMKIMLDWGTKTGSSKYSTLNEVIVGAGFGITPIIAGYVVEVNIYANFAFISIFSIVILGLTFYIYKKMAQSEKRK